MARLSRAQELAGQQIARLVTAEHPPEALATKLLAALAGAVPNDGQVLCALDPGTLLINRLLAIDGGGTMHFGHYLRRVYLVAELGRTSSPELMRAALPAVILHDRIDQANGIPPERFGEISSRDHYRASRERDLPEGGVLRASFASGGRWVATMDMVRDDPRHPFRPTDVAFVRQLGPAIGRGIEAALARERGVGGSAAGPDASGIILVSRGGRVAVQTPAAVALADALGEPWQAEADGGRRLPLAVWAAIARERAAAASSGGGDGVLLVPTAGGSLRVEAGPDGEGGIAVVLTPERPPRAVVVPIGWPVTGREREVIGLVARGLTNRQIADALYVSENTVQTHLSHVYGKLEVTGRGALLARIFADSFLPTVQPPAGPDRPPA